MSTDAIASEVIPPVVVDDPAHDVVDDPAPPDDPALSATADDDVEADRDEELIREIMPLVFDALDDARPAHPFDRLTLASRAARSLLVERGVGPDHRLDRLTFAIARGCCEGDEPSPPQPFDLTGYARGLAEAQCEDARTGEDRAVPAYMAAGLAVQAERDKAQDAAKAPGPKPEPEPDVEVEPPAPGELVTAARIGREHIAQALAALATAPTGEQAAIVDRIGKLRASVAELESQLPGRTVFVDDAEPEPPATAVRPAIVEAQPLLAARRPAPSLVVPGALLGLGMLAQVAAFAILATQSRTARTGD